MAVPSFPSVNVTGPVHHYVRTLNSTNIYYLGTAEVTPQMRRRTYKTDVKNDIAANQLPFQRTYDGEAATLGVLLTRYAKLTEAAIDLRTNPLTLLQSARGRDSRWSRGSLIYGQWTFELWQVFENFSNPVVATPGLEIGWYWPQVELLDHDQEESGTRAQKLQYVFDCTPKWTGQLSATVVAPGEREWLLYSTDPLLFPTDVQVPQ